MGFTKISIGFQTILRLVIFPLSELFIKYPVYSRKCPRNPNFLRSFLPLRNEINSLEAFEGAISSTFYQRELSL
jgi:hypothetical protein